MDEPLLDRRREAPAARTSPRAVAALVCAVLVLPLLSGAAPLALVLGERQGLRVLRQWTTRDGDGGAQRFWLTYEHPVDGTPRELGPLDRPITQADLPEVPVTPGLVAFRAFSVLMLGAPLVLEGLAVLLGASAMKCAGGAVRGRGLALAALVIAALNVVVGACLLGVLLMLVRV